MNSSYSHRYLYAWLAPLALALLATLAGCERTDSLTDNIQGLRFSTDTVRFDSVFAGAYYGSTTRGAIPSAYPSYACYTVQPANSPCLWMGKAPLLRTV